MRLLGNGGEKHSRASAHRGQGQRGDGVAHHTGDDLGVEVFFKHLKTTLRPGLPDSSGQRPDQIRDKSGQSHAQLRMV